MVSQLGGIRHRNDDVLADLGLFHRGAAAVLEQAEAGVAHSSADDVCDWDVGIVVAGSAAGRGGGPVLVSDEEPASGPHPDRDRSGCRCRRRTSSEPPSGTADEHGDRPHLRAYTPVLEVLYYRFFLINLAMTVALHKAARHEFRQVPAT